MVTSEIEDAGLEEVCLGCALNESINKHRRSATLWAIVGVVAAVAAAYLVATLLG